ncbi:hypothetical protein H9L12_11540 [Sphingomonas rhizophila]|uniref:Uncharacterized protein n=1 Tax=Sphingomonas rhizophila TaxID=2071607 RepID=A0A7G9SAH8_9SPHN|nr:hypothetical protein [Sphingomonas rhizophila]QNN64853.1 hypothetical protein H9L12_11540 [Sphingomonas rhizophila]
MVEHAFHTPEAAAGKVGNLDRAGLAMVVKGLGATRLSSAADTVSLKAATPTTARKADGRSMRTGLLRASALTGC